MVGLVIAASVALTVFGTLWLQGVTLRAEQVQMQAVFETVGQIRPGNPVKIRGVRVGRVQDMRVDPGGDVVRIRFTVDEDVPLPDNPAVVLSPESMFGDWQVEIVPRERFPAYRYAAPREPEDLPGYSLPDISQLTATADRISADIEMLTERVGIAFSEETAQNIASLIENVENVTDRLSELVSQQAESFAEVTDEIRIATQEIGSAAASAGESFERVSGILDREEVDAMLRDLAVVAGNFRVLSGELGRTNAEVREMATRVDATFGRFDQLVSRVEEGEGSLGRLMQDPAMAAELELTLRELQLLLEDIRENPRRYLRLSIF
jgi:phospholipid/cholesterol/gamma-HCH transport system substrate-binding protein